MTPDEIRDTKTDSTRDKSAHYEIFWLKEIAYQLALLNQDGVTTHEEA